MTYKQYEDKIEEFLKSPERMAAKKRFIEDMFLFGEAKVKLPDSVTFKKEYLTVTKITTKDEQLGINFSTFSLTIGTESRELKVGSILKTQWTNAPLLKVIALSNTDDFHKEVVCVLYTNNPHEWIPREYLTTLEIRTLTDYEK